MTTTFNSGVKEQRMRDGCLPRHSTTQSYCVQAGSRVTSCSVLFGAFSPACDLTVQYGLLFPIRPSAETHNCAKSACARLPSCQLPVLRLCCVRVQQPANQSVARACAVPSGVPAAVSLVTGNRIPHGNGKTRHRIIIIYRVYIPCTIDTYTLARKFYSVNHRSVPPSI